jgi:surfeit locus 1 family protein
MSLFSPALIILGLAPFFTFGLGTWQMRRLQWKENLIEELTAKLQAEPVPLPLQVKSVIQQLVSFILWHDTLPQLVCCARLCV